MDVVQAANLNEVPGLAHGFFTRDGGLSEGIYRGLNCGYGSNDERHLVMENRARVAAWLGSESGHVATPYQIHSAEAIVSATGWLQSEAPKADAIVTSTPGLVIGVLAADCTPTLYVDPQARVIAACHSGWRGAAAGVIEDTIAKMESLGALRSRIVAAIGPTISQPSYEVGPDFEQAVLAQDRDSRPFFQVNAASGRSHFDLPGYVHHRLMRSGVRQIDRQTPCTYENDSRFFSFRRSTHRNEADYGRQISAIVLI